MIPRIIRFRMVWARRLRSTVALGGLPCGLALEHKENLE
jgi:hypothetical protein